MQDSRKEANTVPRVIEKDAIFVEAQSTAVVASLLDS